MKIILGKRARTKEGQSKRQEQRTKLNWTRRQQQPTATATSSIQQRWGPSVCRADSGSYNFGFLTLPQQQQQQQPWPRIVASQCRARVGVEIEGTFCCCCCSAREQVVVRRSMANITVALELHCLGAAIVVASWRASSSSCCESESRQQVADRGRTIICCLLSGTRSFIMELGWRA